MPNIYVHWKGPYHFTADSFRNLDIVARSSGIYLWYINDILHRVGKCETTIFRRLIEHYTGRLSGDSHIYYQDIESNALIPVWNPVRNLYQIRNRPVNHSQIIEILFDRELFYKNILDIAFEYFDGITIYYAELAEIQAFNGAIQLDDLENQIIHNANPQENHTGGRDCGISVNIPITDPHYWEFSRYGNSEFIGEVD